MVIIELYNETTVIQCRTAEDAEAILARYEGTTNPHYQNLQVREVEVEEETEE